jgi:diguanylate cyclase (GGDEF)-like protein/PAS domain S-box-containing protein
MSAQSNEDASDTLLRLLAERTSDVYWTMDEQGILRYVAPQVRQLIARPPEELIGAPLQALVHEEDFDEAMSVQRAVMTRKDTCAVAYRLKREGAEPVWVEATIHAVRTDEGGVTGFVGSWRDITERRRVEVAFEHQAYHDALTLLPNRRLFEDRLTIALALARRTNSQLALLYLDVDRLSRINDTLGHHIGDEVLRTMAGRLSTCVRASDTLARLGADEFVLIASNLRHIEDSVRIAQQLLQKVAEPLLTPRELFVTASIGIAVFPQDGGEVSTLLASADAAARACKRLGGNGWYLHNSSVNERAMQRLAVEMELHRAVERSEFVVRYQPLLAVQQQHLTAVEALVRWQHPTRGELLPAAFLEVAEETGLIIGVGEQVIDSTCEQARRWLDEGWEGASISVNLSARQFEHPAILDVIDHAVVRHGVPPSVLQIEITEGTALRDLQRSIRVFNELRDRGVRVAIDDFGIGYSSLGYLKELPVNVLKIDRSFLFDIPHGRNAAIVAAVIAMGHALGLTVVAEGVEHPDQMEFLRQHDCDECQGYLFSRPTTADEISRMRRKP